MTKYEERKATIEAEYYDGTDATASKVADLIASAGIEVRVTRNPHEFGPVVEYKYTGWDYKKVNPGFYVSIPDPEKGGIALTEKVAFEARYVAVGGTVDRLIGGGQFTPVYPVITNGAEFNKRTQ